MQGLVLFGIIRPVLLMYNGLPCWLLWAPAATSIFGASPSRGHPNALSAGKNGHRNSPQIHTLHSTRRGPRGHAPSRMFPFLHARCHFPAPALLCLLAPFRGRGSTHPIAKRRHRDRARGIRIQSRESNLNTTMTQTLTLSSTLHSHDSHLG